MNFSGLELDHVGDVDQSLFGSQSVVEDLSTSDFPALTSSDFDNTFGFLHNITHMSCNHGNPQQPTPAHQQSQQPAFTQTQAALHMNSMSNMMTVNSYHSLVSESVVNNIPAHSNTYPNTSPTSGSNRLPSIENFRLKPQGSTPGHITPSELFDISHLGGMTNNNYGNLGHSTSAVINHTDHFSPPTVSTLQSIPGSVSQQSPSPASSVPYLVSDISVSLSGTQTAQHYANSQSSALMQPGTPTASVTGNGVTSHNGGISLQSSSTNSLKAQSPRKANKANSPKKGTRNTNPEDQSKHTLKMTMWSARLFDRWAKWKTEWTHNGGGAAFPHKYPSVPLLDENPSVEFLDYWLAHFVLEVKRKDATPYSEKTLGLIFMGIQRYLNQKFNRSMSIAGDKDFVILHRTMKKRPALQEETSLFHEDEDYLASQKGRANSVRFGPPVILPEIVLHSVDN